MSAAHMLPHQVEILYDLQGSENATSIPVCAGSIISAYLVLTVASCFVGKNESLFRIRAKRENQNDQIRTIDEFYSYAALDSDPSPFDVALVRLSSKLDLDDVHTFKIHYDQSQIPVPGNLSCRASVCHNDGGNNQVKTLAASQCFEILEGKEEINLVCTEPISNVAGGGNQNCQLPLVGSSLICTNPETGQFNFLCGILAINSSTAAQNSGKRLYTSVGAYSHWIRLALEEDDTVRVGDFGLGATSFGGSVVNQNTDPVPYQLSIRLNGSHHCGGVILDKKTALSAAHCFPNNFHMAQYTVVAGEQTLNKDETTEQIFQIEKVITHPESEPVKKGWTVVTSDIAVIQIKGEFSFNNRVNNIWISSPEIPNSGSGFQGFNGTATGWGKTKTGEYEKPSNVLLSVELELMGYEVCKKKWGFLKDHMLCGFSNFSNTCHGDSGGPLVIQNYDHGQKKRTKGLLVGISSFAPLVCEKQDSPNGFTNVASFYEWIAKHRSNSLCSSSQFQCFSGQCIHKELQCSSKYDCDDGSDEKICQPQNVPVLNDKPACGGFINLDEEHEILYKVPPEDRRGGTSCLWIISTGQKDANASIEATILDNPFAQFNPESDIIYVRYSFTNQQSFYTTMSQVGANYTVGGPFMTLYYRTNSSALNAGFHLKLKDSITKSNMTERLNVKLVTIPNADLKTGEIREFSYPSSVSGASRYSSNERTFFLLKPQHSGAAMRVNLTFVDTEEKWDWLEVGTYKIKPVLLTRFSGLSNWTEKILEGLEDEPLYFYFHSDVSVERGGFKMKYSAIMAPKSETTEIPTVTFYENKEFSGSELKINVRASCQDIPHAWNDKVSSLRSSSCVTFYHDGSCSHRSRQLTGNQADLSLHHLDNHISSFEPCETTNKREKSGLFVTAYEHENYRGESIRVALDCGCLGFKFGWNDRINSIQNPGNLCVIGYKHEGCTGKTTRITSDASSFTSVGMNSSFTTFKICRGTSDCPFEERAAKLSKSV